MYTTVVCVALSQYAVLLLNNSSGGGCRGRCCRCAGRAWDPCPRPGAASTGHCRMNWAAARVGRKWWRWCTRNLGLRAEFESWARICKSWASEWRFRSQKGVSAQRLSRQQVTGFDRELSCEARRVRQARSARADASLVGSLEGARSGSAGCGDTL